MKPRAYDGRRHPGSKGLPVETLHRVRNVVLLEHFDLVLDVQPAIRCQVIQPTERVSDDVGGEDLQGNEHHAPLNLNHSAQATSTTDSTITSVTFSRMSGL